MGKFKIICGVLGLVAGALIWTLNCLPDGFLRIWFLDIGQGDAILMESGLSEWIMVDGGPDDTVLTRMGEIMPFYEHTIKLIILSHPHADHMNGLIGVLERYEVESIVMTGVRYDYAGYEKLYQLAAEKGVKIIFVDGSFDLRLGKIGIDLIYPEKNLQGGYFNNVNNSSVVFRLIYGDNSAFFSGDLEIEKEEEIAKQVHDENAAGENILNLDADILKAGHHGSKTSNSEEFVSLISPDFAVISCGVDNKFNHPFAGTLERFSRLGATIYRTDIDGTIEAKLDGTNITFVTGGKI